MRPRRFEILLDAADKARLHEAAASRGLSEAEIVRAQLRPLLDGSFSITGTFRSLRIEGLQDEAAFLRRNVERLDDLAHQHEPGSILRGLISEARDEARARLQRIERDIESLTKDVK